jgi:hypothetical protein
MKQENTKKKNLSVLDKDYISKLKKEFDEITGDDEVIEPSTLEYFENFNEYFLKYPKK